MTDLPAWAMERARAVWSDTVMRSHDGAYSVIARALVEAHKAGMMEGYLLGWQNSSEGWNGEYPGLVAPEADTYWVERRDAAIRSKAEELG